MIEGAQQRRMKSRKRIPPVDFGAPEDDRHRAFAPSSSPASDPHAGPLMFAVDPASRGSLQTSQAEAAVTTASSRMPTRPGEAEGATRVALEDAAAVPAGWPIYLVALVVAVLWALGPIAFAVGYRNGVQPLRNDTFALAVFALMAIGPAVFVFGAAYVVRQAQKLTAETRRAKAMTDAMLTPALIAASRTGGVVQNVRDEITRAGTAAEDARETLLALRDALAAETDQLLESTEVSIRSAHDLVGTLGRERSEMRSLAQGLDAQAVKVADSISQQAKMVSEASDLAETQLREAEAVLASRAADLAAAAGEASDAARTAGEDLTRHIARLETAGVGVAEQVRAVEGGLGDQRAALITLASVLKANHASFSNEAEAHAEKLSEFISQARLSAMEMNDRALKGGDSLRQLMADAAEQFRDLAETARAEREEFGQSTLQSLDAVSEAAAAQRVQMESQTRAAVAALANAAEETREAAARHAATAREQVDQLSEAAFSAGQKANQVFEARLTEARALVEQSSQLVDQAGAATAKKLESGAAAARATMVELQEMMGEIEQRAQRLPVSARGQVDLVRAAVAKGMDELTSQARRTAEEAQAIDAAFQERVRRNFEMLGEAVRLMGGAATAPLSPLSAWTPPPTTVTPAVAAKRAAASVPPPLAPEPSPEPVAVADEGELTLDELVAAAPALEKQGGGAELAEKLGLRPGRLKLTPTATDEEFSAVFEAAGGPGVDAAEPPAEGEAWTWKDLLASIDGADADGERLQDILALELSHMGVDPSKLLPKARVDEIAAAVQTGDLDGARAVVKRLAPAAIRRIGRRLFTDEGVRRQVQVYVRRYQTLVDDAVVRDPEGFLMANLLGDDAGRLYLLLDAAAGDLV
jgi:hypothetical protein